MTSPVTCFLQSPPRSHHDFTIQQSQPASFLQPHTCTADSFIIPADGSYSSVQCFQLSCCRVFLHALNFTFMTFDILIHKPQIFSLVIHFTGSSDANPREVLQSDSYRARNQMFLMFQASKGTPLFKLCSLTPAWVLIFWALHMFFHKTNACDTSFHCFDVSNPGGKNFLLNFCPCLMIHLFTPHLG